MIRIVQLNLVVVRMTIAIYLGWLGVYCLLRLTTFVIVVGGDEVLLHLIVLLPVSGGVVDLFGLGL